LEKGLPMHYIYSARNAFLGKNLIRYDFSCIAGKTVNNGLYCAEE